MVPSRFESITISHASSATLSNWNHFVCVHVAVCVCVCVCVICQEINSSYTSLQETFWVGAFVIKPMQQCSTMKKRREREEKRKLVIQIIFREQLSATKMCLELDDCFGLQPSIYNQSKCLANNWPWMLLMDRKWLGIADEFLMAHPDASRSNV